MVTKQCYHNVVVLPTGNNTTLIRMIGAMKKFRMMERSVSRESDTFHRSGYKDSFFFTSGTVDFLPLELSENFT